jgi:5-formyltetrahydrofolate cyclo-ligase
MDLRTRKGRMRRAMAARRRAVPAGRAERAGEAVATRIAGLPEWRDVTRVALYVATDGELPVVGLLAHARAGDRPLLWPRVDGEDLVFAECAPEELEPGAFGIPAPPGDRPAAALGKGDLVVVPGLAFDATGARLGRGRGYYDRALPAAGAAGLLVVGVGYDFQCVEAVPVEEGDQRVDLVATEHRTIDARGVRR